MSEALAETIEDAELVHCVVCGEPYSDVKWWQDVPGFGEVCDPCHQGLDDGEGGLLFKSPAAYCRWMHGYCECRTDTQRIGVAVQCRYCRGWIE
jgi:hypothetical protein